MTEALVVQPKSEAAVLTPSMSVDDAVAHFNKIELIAQRVLKQGVKDGTGDYGVMPGTQQKVLFKAGAEKLCTVFRLGANYTIEKVDRDGDHVSYTVRCTLTHQTTGMVMGSALGLCSTKESKYRYRTAGRTCPICKAEAIIKGKKEYDKTGGDGGWLCFKKRAGCGATFKDNDPQITGQDVGKIENPDIADIENTVLKMAEKRAHVAVTLNVLGISSLFTQDILDAASEAIRTGYPGKQHDAQDEAEHDIPVSPPPKKTTPAADAALRKDAAGTHGPAPSSASGVALPNADDSPLEAEARDLIGKATTIEQLQAVWTGGPLKELMSVASDGEKVHITNMKNKRKRELAPDQS